MPKKEKQHLPLIEGEPEPPEPVEEEVTAVEPESIVELTPEPIVEPAPVATVPAGSLLMGQQFGYQGRLYRRTGLIEEKILGIRLVEEHGQMFTIPDDRVLLDMDAQVIAK